MCFGFPCQLESTSRVVSCKVRVTLSSHAFSRVHGYVVYMTFIGSSVFRTLNKVRRKKIVPDRVFHVVLPRKLFSYA